MSTFCTAGINNSTTRLGCHSGTETVTSFSLDITWLECSFHLYNTILLLNIKRVF